MFVSAEWRWRQGVEPDKLPQLDLYEMEMGKWILLVLQYIGIACQVYHSWHDTT